jgi:hypothetical protein
MVWVRKGQVIHSYISQLKDTGNVLNTTLFKSSSDVSISRMTSVTWVKAAFEASEMKVYRGVGMVKPDGT